MHTNISFWMNSTQDKTLIYIVPRHADMPPKAEFKKDWTPVSITYADHAHERFLEECRIHHYTFLSENEIEKVTGIRQMREFGINIYVITNAAGQYWNMFYGWMSKLSEASRFTHCETDNVKMPGGGTWLQLC
jgi:hypothetical protein